MTVGTGTLTIIEDLKVGDPAGRVNPCYIVGVAPIDFSGLSAATVTVGGDITLASGEIRVLVLSTLTAPSGTFTIGDAFGIANPCMIVANGATFSVAAMEFLSGDALISSASTFDVVGNMKLGDAAGSIAGSVDPCMVVSTSADLAVGGSLLIEGGTLTLESNATMDVTGDVTVADSHPRYFGVPLAPEMSLRPASLRRALPAAK